MLAGLVVVAIAMGIPAHDAYSQDDSNANGGGFCSRVADDALTACGFSARSDFWIAKGNCVNVVDAAERKTCNDDAQSGLKDAQSTCDEQRTARQRACGIVGQDRYDPEFDPAQFVDPDKIGHGVAPNPYFPLVRGTEYTYRQKLPNGKPGQITTDTVSDKTKFIAGVHCRVVEDRVSENGVVIEATDDWYAQDLAGNVWYCGEIAPVYEVFKGDHPQDPELVSIEGSFKAGRDSAKQGILALASPQVGDGYYEEFALGVAEDVAHVISTTGSASVPAAICNKTCLVTRNTSSLDLDLETKYYAPGIGLILEADPDGTRNELIKITH